MRKRPLGKLDWEEERRLSADASRVELESFRRFLVLASVTLGVIILISVVGCSQASRTEGETKFCMMCATQTVTREVETDVCKKEHKSDDCNNQNERGK